MFTRIHFQTIGVTDMARALEFYTSKLGFLVERDISRGAFRWIFLKLPGAGTLLHFDLRPSLEPGSTPALVLLDDDVDATCPKLVAGGVEVVDGPDDARWEPGVRWAQFRDSEGNLIFIQTIKGS